MSATLPTTSARADHALLRLEDVSKTYPPHVEALKHVTLAIGSGEVTALLGANGAGKSTIARLLTGVELPTTGTIYLDGAPVEITKPSIANRLGFAAVHQELPLLPNLTATENLSLGHTHQRFLDVWTPGAARRAYLELAQEIPEPPPPNALIGQLTVAQRQKVAFIRALSMEPRVLIVDEGTSSLSAEERHEMQTLLRRLARDRDIGVIYITHFIDDALTGADRIVALQDGRLAFDKPASETRQDEILRVLGAGETAKPAPVGDGSGRMSRLVTGTSVGVTARDVTCEGAQGVSFEVGVGECVGLYGPPGCGASEVLRAVAGLLPHTGTVEWRGRDLPRRMAQRVQENVIYCNGDRAKNLVLPWTVERNISLLYLFKHGLLSVPRGKVMRDRATSIVSEFEIVGSAFEPVRNLSGGNQQRVAAARAVSVGAPLLLLGDDLTRGVDVAGRNRIHQLLQTAAGKGASVLLYSTDPEELVKLCARVVVLREGSVVAELKGAALTVSALEVSVRMRRDPVPAAVLDANEGGNSE